MESVCIFSTDDLSEAENIKTILQENDIQSMMKNVYTQNIFGGLKPFSGHDPIAGSIQIFILENQVDKALEILNNENDFSEEINNEKIEDEVEEDNIDVEQNIKIMNTSPTINRTIYFSFLLSAMSFLIIPYFINIPFLIKLFKVRKTLFYMLLIQSTIFLIGSLLFIVFS